MFGWEISHLSWLKYAYHQRILQRPALACIDGKRICCVECFATVTNYDCPSLSFSDFVIPEGNLIAIKVNMQPRFFTYMLTNQYRTILYTGMSNDLAARIVGHYIGKEGSFSTNYRVSYLVWYEETKYVLNAIAREKEIKHFTRPQKEALINEINPEWRFLNEEVLGNWPPTEAQIDAIKEKWQQNGLPR